MGTPDPSTWDDPDPDQPDSWHGQVCTTYWNDAHTQSCRVCVLVNQHDVLGWKQTIAQFNRGNGTGASRIFVSYVSLFKQVGTSWVRQQITNYYQWYPVTNGVEFDLNTGWDADCPVYNWKGKAAFDIEFKDGTLTGAVTLFSAPASVGC